MVNNDKFYTEYIIPPGHTLLEILDDRNMSQKELAIRTSLTPKHINNIIKGTASITPDTALKFETVLETPASFWLNLESDFQENKARIKAREKIDSEKNIIKEIPYNDMVKNGWLEAANNIIDKVLNLRMYFKVSSLETLSLTHEVAFRKSKSFSANDYSLITWLTESERRAESVTTEDYDRNLLMNVIPEIRKLTLLPFKASYPKLTKICSSVGIALVITPPINKAHINGATKWLSNNKVMIALSLRGGYEDIFWFTFFHELGHVLQEKKNSYFIDSDNEGNELDIIEKEADDFAINNLVPKEEFNSIVKSQEYKDLGKLRLFSERNKIDLGIIVGRLMKEEHVDFSDMKFLKFRRKLPKINY
ncbi:HigA family addiction module antitoxin (plasmid) [Metabacillus halosaccharovorans]|uniref:HigA family addiction module antitoxin n=1 Tax=Metabacillus halosaccharovorans TaxID=930124 RepID=UPI0020400AD8|nr:HigA family addiction module antitoxin [Metabacillus halosaccharovorans]MCM3441559.1 HigA family addiction module antitoxin [Metabacillus halosaccharovorans]